MLLARHGLEPFETLRSGRSGRRTMGSAMQRTAKYIEELSGQLSQLAQQHGLQDLAYLLKLASEEARANVERAAEGLPSASGETRG